MAGVLLFAWSVWRPGSVSCCRSELPGELSCGLTRRRGRGAFTVAGSDSRTRQVDEIQSGHDEGPACILATGQVVVYDYLASDDRWSDYQGLARGSATSPGGAGVAGRGVARCGRVRRTPPWVEANLLPGRPVSRRGLRWTQVPPSGQVHTRHIGRQRVTQGTTGRPKPASVCH